MKYLKLFEEINLKSLSWYNNKILSELKTVINFTIVTDEDHKNFDRTRYREIYNVDLNNDIIGLSASNIIKKKQQISAILNKWKSILIKQGFILTFKFSNGLEETYLIYKELYKGRVKPERFIYHVSPSKNRESILSNGLIPKSSSESEEWNKDISLSYPKSIFAANGINGGLWHTWYNNDIWQIDTTKISNKWYLDLNLQSKYRIMTFEPIPASALTLISDNKNFFKSI